MQCLGTRRCPILFPIFVVSPHDPSPPPAVSEYVEIFRVHGDIHSFLYTGSPAMHSHVLSLVVQVGWGCSG